MTKLIELMRSIASAEASDVLRLLAASPDLATARMEVGASRQQTKPYYLSGSFHYLYVGDTALHAAASTYRTEIVRKLVNSGADVQAQNRLGAQPLHYAVMGVPGSPAWNPRAQAATIACLIEAGADPNAPDKHGVAPLHRAIRTRCAAAVKVLLENGADVRLKNKKGSTPMLLATQNTGRGGSGSPEAKLEQEKIVRLLEQYDADAAN